MNPVSLNTTSVADDAIVITATGLACGLGLDAETAWQNILAGRRGIGPMPAMESPLPPGSDGGQALDLPADFAPDLPREARYLRWAITQALTNAGDLPYPPDRRAVMLGTTLHGMRAAGRFLRTTDYSQLKDFLAGDVLATSVAGLGLHGGAATTCSACSSGLGAIALGVTLLQTGEADVVVAGGYDPISEYAWAGFNALRLVSGPPLRPFAKGRVGMKLAEAYAVVVLERAGDARRRGAKVIATIAGYGETADAHHLTQPHPQGRGAAAAMRQAIAAAHLAAGDIGLACAHATGTPDNDAAEHAALADIFGERLPTVPVVAFKGHLGHTLGGAGAIELIFAAHALRDDLLPPTVLDDSETVEFPDLRLTRVGSTGTSQATAANASHPPAPLRATLNTSLGFGGANTSVVLTPAPMPAAQRVRISAGIEQSLAPSPQTIERATSPRTRQAVVITGVGVILPGIYDRDAFRARVTMSDINAVTTASHVPRETIDMAKVEALLNARRTRRMSDYVKLTLAAATLAARQAFGHDNGGAVSIPAATAAILGTTHGSANFSEVYYRQILAEGVTAANPSLFAEGVPNAAAAQLSLMLGLTGPCQTILGTRTAGLDALRLSMLRIQNGEWDRAIVSAGEEDSPIVAAAYAHCGAGPADDTAAAVALVIESADAAAARGAIVLATLTDSAATGRAAPGDSMALVRVLDALPRADRAYAITNGIYPVSAARNAGRWQSTSPLMRLAARRFSVSPLVALVAAIEIGGLTLLAADDHSGIATAVRLEATNLRKTGGDMLAAE